MGKGRGLYTYFLPNLRTIFIGLLNKRLILLIIVKIFGKISEKYFFGVNFFLGSYLRGRLQKEGAKLYNFGYPVGLIEMCGSVEVRTLSRVYGNNIASFTGALCRPYLQVYKDRL